jgi:hypothetical protein
MKLGRLVDGVYWIARNVINDYAVPRNELTS